MGIKIGQHAADGMGDQLLVVDGFDIPLLDGVEHLGEGSQFLDGKRGAHILFGHRRKLQADQHPTQQSRTKQSGLFQLTHRYRSSALSFQIDPFQRVERLPLMT